MLLLAFQMPLGNAALTALLGMVVVITILAVLSLLVRLLSKLVTVSEKKKIEAPPPPPLPETLELPQEPLGTPLPASASQGKLELIATDEPTAAVLMAIVSEQSGIPLNQLVFKSIRLLAE